MLLTLSALVVRLQEVRIDKFEVYENPMVGTELVLLGIEKEDRGH